MQYILHHIDICTKMCCWQQQVNCWKLFYSLSFTDMTNLPDCTICHWLWRWLWWYLVETWHNVNFSEETAVWRHFTQSLGHTNCADQTQFLQITHLLHKKCFHCPISLIHTTKIPNLPVALLHSHKIGAIHPLCSEPFNAPCIQVKLRRTVQENHNTKQWAHNIPFRSLLPHLFMPQANVQGAFLQLDCIDLLYGEPQASAAHWSFFPGCQPQLLMFSQKQPGALQAGWNKYFTGGRFLRGLSTNSPFGNVASQQNSWCTTDGSGTIVGVVYLPHSLVWWIRPHQLVWWIRPHQLVWWIWPHQLVQWIRLVEVWVCETRETEKIRGQTTYFAKFKHRRLAFLFGNLCFFCPWVWQPLFLARFSLQVRKAVHMKLETVKSGVHRGCQLVESTMWQLQNPQRKPVECTERCTWESEWGWCNKETQAEFWVMHRWAKRCIHNSFRLSRETVFRRKSVLFSQVHCASVQPNNIPRLAVITNKIQISISSRITLRWSPLDRNVPFIFLRGQGGDRGWRFLTLASQPDASGHSGESKKRQHFQDCKNNDAITFMNEQHCHSQLPNINFSKSHTQGTTWNGLVQEMK